MDNVLVLQYNMNKISTEQAHDVYESVRNYLMTLDDPPCLIGLPDGMSLISCSFDELRGVRNGLDRAISELERNHDS